MGFDFQKYVDDAKIELASKSLDKIQQETALKWAGRYAATIELASNSPYQDALYDRYVKEAAEYRSEALEHAAQVKDEMFYSTIRMLIG